ncbi:MULTISPECIES: signal peptide peptidase SppA [unclassified Mucilaginibacter]|uniref:signal peptide peptidase SppA n=1 Tax=unclassified Mucilaginibacter TaxID=2617802 RepID=UPI002AC98AEE|nr:MULTISPECIES: signal peptide peptidase SppA [unclassified Mucilaginibacter]MEB0261509.1 signal peptide peptidase SppA [Mucilaginibacter sp. 10I4]MEB0277854.1 signal peptide peptidase SppA [Mucilaginibacter sp. 10B2]MEB0300599.1 signal peptide peptidase SppA [Mucilaginibacter sp. 5C4]WPX22746.1 signal peptide peptidase SppA [Mucilaginibacter sp. 5C4]
MKQFFKFVFATIVGFTLIFVIGFAILLGIIAAASSDKTVDVDANSVLHIKFTTPINERTPNNPLANLSFLGLDGEKSIGLNDILAGIKKAKTDDNIKGVFLDESYMMSGQATTEEIRNALIDFKKSKKFVIAYSEIYTQGFYYLASVADKVYINPKGIFEFRGFSSEITFLKGALDKLGIEAQVIKVGTYKSAVEPYILTKMSDANRLQVTSYLGSMYDYFLTGIAKSRNINKDSLFNYANSGLIQQPEDALKYKLIDGLKYKDEILSDLKSRTGKSEKKDISSVELADYLKSSTKTTTDPDDVSSSNRIAIVYASGEINGGDGNDNSIGSETISKALRKVRMDDKVKAVVLRVNSPGGSSLASDVIWREVMLTKKVKPIIVSMGDVAASGGYYIACAADSIIAEPNTITGSIGIFAILPNMQKLFTDKLGLSFDGVKTGKYADLGDVSRPLTPEERAILQNSVNHGYDDFTKAVAAGRGKTQAYINSIGQGRVWTGTQALKNGLVDRLGNINDAVASAAKKAKLKDYKLVSYPEQKSIFNKFGEGLSAEVKAHFVQSELGDNYRYYEQIKGVTKMMRTPQARMPYDVVIK